MIRILHVITTLRTGGAETMLVRLLSAHSPEWSPVVVSLEDRGTLGEKISQLGIPVHALGLRGSLPNPLRAISLLPLVRRLEPQVIQGWMPHGNLTASAARAVLPESAPVFWNVRMTLDSLGAERWLTATAIRLGALYSRGPAAIIYNSRVAAAQHEAIGYCPRRRTIIPNGFDCRLFRSDERARQEVRAGLGVDLKAVLIGLIARFHPMKDHATFLQAAARVARAQPAARFLLAGTGVTWEQPALQKLIVEHGLQERVLLLGERSDVPRLTAALDIACSASWNEGFSNTIGEAMACGVPCVATSAGDTSADLIADTGGVAPPRDPAALAQAILRLIEAGSEQRRQLGLAARQRIESRFSLPAIARRYEDLYKECLEEPPEAAARMRGSGS